MADLLKVVNASGFLFQLAVETVARATANQSGWNVFAVEHPWTSTNGDRGGFIDLILRQNAMRLVIECKRVRDGNWIYLIPEADRTPKQVNRLLWTHRQSDEPNISGYHQFQIKPQSVTASYCVVRGSGENDVPMLERLASGHLAAIDALAQQELDAGSASRFGDLAVYIPVIVTNADLFVCKFAPNDVELGSGLLTQANFDPVPFLRFEKSLLFASQVRREYEDVPALNQLSIATVFIVNASAFEGFLSECMLHGNPDSPMNPWVNLRGRGN